MVNDLIVLILVIIAGFIPTYLIAPFLIKRMKERGIVGKDMNKLGQPEIPELGGISVIFGFSFALLIAIFISTYFGIAKFELTMLLAGFITVLIIGFIGITDDLVGWRKGIRQWQHALFPLFAALPLMAVAAGTTEMALPFLGVVSFGIFYSLVLVPIGVTGASNAFNMVAGMNGLEAGMGIICSASLLIVSIFNGSIEASIILAGILGALIAFMLFNWYPAKVFPGDSLTLMIGAGFAAAAILGNMEKIAIMMMAIYFIELVFKGKHKFQSQCFGIPQKDGTLSPRPEGGSITQWIMKQGKFTEKQVVLIVLGMQIAVCAVVLALFWLNYIGMIII